MKFWDIVVICVIAIWFVLAVGYIIYRKKQGKNICGCDSSSCTGDCLHCGQVCDKKRK